MMVLGKEWGGSHRLNLKPETVLLSVLQKICILLSPKYPLKMVTLIKFCELRNAEEGLIFNLEDVKSMFRVLNYFFFIIIILMHNLRILIAF